MRGSNSTRCAEDFDPSQMLNKIAPYCSISTTKKAKFRIFISSKNKARDGVKSETLFRQIICDSNVCFYETRTLQMRSGSKIETKFHT